MNTYHVYTACISPALNGSSALEHYEHGNAIEIRNGIMFNFYVPGTATFIYLHTCLDVWENNSL